ncbi:hypothetical protein CU103_12295 [Phyllobacterium sophorae]|uniref:Uncharacterized protein n=1 Tax=Phyllobacterium sophorae TaxID=1520277 RepID=A0A2P7BDV4_9HYPH|nr:hypothetical protein CU103_12295 [Phyllobacterium sophorae]
MSKTSKTTQENKPPKWAEPLLKEAAAEGMDLYKSGNGYNPYTGPTRAGFSDASLGGMNNALAATGYTGPSVTNQTWQNNPAIAQARQVIEQLKAKRATAQQRAPRVDPEYASRLQALEDRLAKEKSTRRTAGNH